MILIFQALDNFMVSNPLMCLPYVKESTAVAQHIINASQFEENFFITDFRLNDNALGGIISNVYFDYIRTDWA